MDVLAPVLNGGPVKVAHNAKFDAGFLYEAPGGVMPEPLYDTMLADQVLNNRAYPRGLSDVALEYLGVPLDKRQQTSDWAVEVLTEDQVKYAATDAAVLLPLYRALGAQIAEAGLTKTADLENRMIAPVVWMERGGVGFNREAWDSLAGLAQERADRYRGRLDRLVLRHMLVVDDQLDAATPMVNWNSSPQVRSLLNNIGLDVKDTKRETLDPLRDEHPIVGALIDYREASKRANTYGTRWANSVVHPRTSRVHANWRQIGAVTGRMACAEPNLQNLPRDPAYRACFSPAPGHIFVKADYNQIELRIAAEMAPDARMMRAFAECKDVHAVTAALLLNKREEAVTRDERQLAKAISLGFVFGMGTERLAEYARVSFGVSLDEDAASDLRRKFFDAYAGIRHWQRLQGYKTETRTVLGRRRVLDGGGDYNAKLNSPIQGTCADGLKLALARLWETRGTVDVVPVLVAHDEIVVECPTDKAEEAKAWLVRCMREGMEEFLRKVPVVVEAEIKSTW